MRYKKILKVKMLPYVPIPTEDEFQTMAATFRKLFPFKNIKVKVLHEQPISNDGRYAEFVSSDEPNGINVMRISPFMCHAAMEDCFEHEWTHAVLYDEGYRYWYKHTKRFALKKIEIENKYRKQE